MRNLRWRNSGCLDQLLFVVSVCMLPHGNGVQRHLLAILTIHDSPISWKATGGPERAEMGGNWKWSHACRRRIRWCIQPRLFFSPADTHPPPSSAINFNDFIQEGGRQRTSDKIWPSSFLCCSSTIDPRSVCGVGSVGTAVPPVPGGVVDLCVMGIGGGYCTDLTQCYGGACPDPSPEPDCFVV